MGPSSSRWYISPSWPRAGGAELGVAAHWAYKDGSPSEDIAWLNRIIDWQAETDADGFTALNFAPADPLYFDYNVTEADDTSNCANAASDTTIYTFSAFGDLDGDTSLSTFQLSAGSNPDNALYRAPGIYSNDPLE